jgi:hypothetical protein
MIDNEMILSFSFSVFSWDAGDVTTEDRFFLDRLEKGWDLSVQTQCVNAQLGILMLIEDHGMTVPWFSCSELPDAPLEYGVP